MNASEKPAMTKSDPAAAGTASTASLFFPAVRSLAARELLRFFRQRTRLVGALGQPLIFWILFGSGLRGSFQAPEWAAGAGMGMSYQEYFFPGVAVLIILFTAIFSTISIIEDRREGFLQGVLVSPIPRASIVTGKLVGGTLLALIQTGLFLAIGPALAALGMAPPMQIEWGISEIVVLLLFLTVLGFALTGLGYMIAWPMESTQGFHAIMSVFLMPMWLLSGAFFPGQEGWIAWVIRLNPLSYGVAGVRRLLYPQWEASTATGLPSLPLCIAVTLGFAAATMTGAIWLTQRRSIRDSR